MPMSSLPPQHVAIIMDGNGRWAKDKHMPRSAGHKKGVDVARTAIEYFARAGVRYLTMFAFSSENWNRPEQEVSALMDLFLSALGKEAGQLAENNIRLRILGDQSRFPDKVADAMQAAEASTRHCDQMEVLIAANYGGHWDITQSVRELAEQVKQGTLEPADISATLIEDGLSTGDVPAPDLMIRTGGEYRISNFLVWQLAYTELYFTELYWPQMDAEQFGIALEYYQDRERRFGKTSEQLKELG